MEAKFTPIDDQLLIKANDADVVSAGGIIIPDQAQERPQLGIVVGVGPGKRHHKTGERKANCVNVGDQVLFGKHVGLEVTWQGEEHLVVKNEHVLAILN